MAEDDYESENLTAGALIVHEYNDLPSNFRSAATLSDIMEKYKIPGIYGLDTRKLVRSIRDYGSRKVLITDASTWKGEGIEILKKTDIPRDAVSKVSCQHIWKSRVILSSGLNYDVYSSVNSQSTKTINLNGFTQEYKWHKKHVVAIDCGMKKNIVLSLNRMGIDVTIVPWNTSAKDIMDLRPDGIFISNGPGDPEDAEATIATVKELIGKYPIFGICLGHQIISLAYGAKTYKLKFGHRGGNHPVKNLETGKIEITSQNHSYAVDPESVKNTKLKITHMNILDNTVEGVSCEADKVFSVQYHPESAPGPQDSRYLFDKFLNMLK